jgi:hypothetical protein
MSRPPLASRRGACARPAGALLRTSRFGAQETVRRRIGQNHDQVNWPEGELLGIREMAAAN